MKKDPITKSSNTKNSSLLNNIVELSKKLIDIQSTTYNIKTADEALSLLKEQLKSFTIESFHGHRTPTILIHNAKPNTKHFKIILNAHLDVVPGKSEQFTSFVKDGKLFGRGAYDMKAAAATLVYLFKEIASKVTYPFALQLVTDEEIPGEDGTKTQLNTGITTDFAIIGECGSNLDVIYESKGVIHATLRAYGKRAHGGYPWRGENAIMKIYYALDKLHKDFPIPKEETFDTIVNVSKIETSNETWNLVPEDCSATLDIRVNRKDHKSLLAKLREALPEGVTLEVNSSKNAHYITPNDKYITNLQKAGEKVLGKRLITRKAFGGSDACFFTEAGYGAIEFGPVGGNQHHEDEWVDINSLENYYQILKQFLLAVNPK